MKKLALLLMVIWSSSAVAETVYYGTINGTVRDYYPDVYVTKVVLYNNTATSGVKGDLIDRSKRNEKILIDQFVKEGKILCKNDKGYFIDNLKLKHTPFGDLNNIFTEISANVVCVGKGK